MKRITYIAIILFCVQATTAWGQNQAITEPQLFYTKRIQLGLNLNTSGLGGINFKYGWHKTGRKKNILDTEIARVRHPKETRIYGASENPQEYTFGRLNMAFFIRTGYGQTIMLTERPYKNAVGVNFNYAVGINTVLLKPIYLDISRRIESDPGKYIVQAERYNPEVHTDQNSIYGNSSFFEGISNTSAKVGGYARASLSVEWGAYPDEFHTLEAGITLDVFPDALPLMAYEARTKHFVLFYLGYSFGWNK